MITSTSNDPIVIHLLAAYSAVNLAKNEIINRRGRGFSGDEAIRLAELQGNIENELKILQTHLENSM